MLRLKLIILGNIWRRRRRLLSGVCVWDDIDIGKTRYCMPLYDIKQAVFWEEGAKSRHSREFRGQYSYQRASHRRGLEIEAAGRFVLAG